LESPRIDRAASVGTIAPSAFGFRSYASIEDDPVAREATAATLGAGHELHTASVLEDDRLFAVGGVDLRDLVRKLGRFDQPLQSLEGFCCCSEEMSAENDRAFLPHEQRCED
jgi:hypothetical protein